MDYIKTSDEMPASGKRVMLFYKNTFGSNIVTTGYFVEKFTDENYDEESEFYEYDEESDKYYVPQGWYEHAFNHDDFVGYWLDNQNVAYWAELPKIPKEMV